MSARPRPLRVALTGGIATGKSYCLARFASRGAPVIDADALAHDVLMPGTPGGDAVLARFGTLDRHAIGAVVFQDAQARRDLEAIVHPKVYAGITAWFGGLKASAPFGIADIPLVFESGHERDFDRVILTSCGRDQQLGRLMERGLSREAAEARMAAQLPFEEKLARARAAGLGVDVVDTSGTLQSTDDQVDRIFNVLAALPPRVCS